MRHKTLIHGSNTLIDGDYLLPHVSFDYVPLVYATNDAAYALIRCGKFRFNDVAIKEESVNGHHTLIELRPHAFQDVFDTEGYLYEVRREDFEQKNDEYVCASPVKVLKCYRVFNVYTAMRSIIFYDRYTMVSHNEAPAYFAQHNINLAAYLERRAARTSKLAAIHNLNKAVKQQMYL